MNSATQQPNETALHAVDYWQVIKNRYGIILLTLLLVFMTASVITYVMPKKFESEATIEIRPRTGGMSIGFGSRDSSAGSIMTPQFFGTEFEKIKSSNSLSKVVDNLQLVNTWGCNKESAIGILKGIVNTQNIRGTDLISIRVRHTSKEDARNITMEVAKAYKEYRSEIENGDSTKALYELNKAVRNQEDKVEERRKVLSTIVITKGIIFKGKDSYYGDSGVDEDSEARTAQERYNQLESEKMLLSSQINSLEKINSEELMRFCSGLDLPENIIRTLYPEYLTATRQLSDLKIKGLGDNHPTVKAAAGQIVAMKRQLDEGGDQFKSYP